MTPYETTAIAISLIAMVFTIWFALSVKRSIEKLNIKVHQFFINMPELFERYVEIKLREIYKERLWVGYKYNNFETPVGKLRPDFLVKDEGLIIDAKYKYFYNFPQNNPDELKKELQQLVLYGRTQKIIDKTGKIKKHIIVYPDNNAPHDFNPANFEKIEEFEKFYIIGIDISKNRYK